MVPRITLSGKKCDTKYAPIAALLAYYRKNDILQLFSEVEDKRRRSDFTTADKLFQAFVSILAGCETLSEVNVKLKGEDLLARAGGWSRFADQSTLSKTLDGLNRKQIWQLQQIESKIWHKTSHALRHDWRGYLWVDFDLSGLQAGPRAEGSKKGYFSGKKTQQGGN